MSAQSQALQQIEYVEGQQIAFIHNKEDCLPGIVTAVNYDDTYDLEVYLPMPTTKIDWLSENKAFKRITTVQLVSNVRLKARPCDPRAIFAKTSQETSSAAQNQGEWATIARYRDTGKRHKVPRWNDWHTNIVGCFFDPSQFVYKLYCHRFPFEVRGQTIPEETLLYPKKKEFYTEYSKVFNKYFKEYHASLGKWNRVEIQAFLPQAVKVEVEIKETLIDEHI